MGLAPKPAKKKYIKQNDPSRAKRSGFGGSGFGFGWSQDNFLTAQALILALGKYQVSGSDSGSE